MAVQDAPSTIDFGVFSPGSNIYAGDVQELLKVQHWTATHRQINHLSLQCGRFNWSGLLSPGTLRFKVDGTNREVINTDMWIDTDAAQQSLQCGAWIHTNTTGTDTIVVTFSFTGTVGTSSNTVSYIDTTPDGDELTATVGLSGVTAGDEWVQCKISVQRTVGSDTGHTVGGLRVTETTYAASSLADPQDD